jgi:pilus assembly protein CpaB
MSPADAPETRAVSQIRVRALLFLLLAVGAGGGAVFLFKQYLDRMRSTTAAATQTVPVVVAAMDVPIAARLEAKHLEVVQWPRAHMPAGTIGATADVVDHTLRTSVVKGEPILKERLADEKEGRGLAALLAEGMRAMAVSVDSAVGVAGFVQPGDFVDVLTTMSPDADTVKVLGADPARMSKIILQNVLVLAVGEHLETEGSKPVQVKVVTLGVTPEESERLALAGQYGRLTLTMRARIDQKIAATAGITPVQLLSPDEGAAEHQVVEPAEPRITLRPTAHRRREPAVVAAVPVAAPPEAPVVEILRGSKIEQRKLRAPDPTAQPE